VKTSIVFPSTLFTMSSFMSSSVTPLPYNLDYPYLVYTLIMKGYWICWIYVTFSWWGQFLQCNTTYVYHILTLLMEGICTYSCICDLHFISFGGCHGHDGMVIGFLTNVVSSNLAQARYTLYSIKW